MGCCFPEMCFGSFSGDVFQSENGCLPDPRVSLRTIILVPGYVRSPSNSGLPAPGLDNFLECPGRGACPSPGLYSPGPRVRERGLETAQPDPMQGRRGSPARALRADPRLPAPPPTGASRHLLTSDSWGRREPGRGRRGIPRRTPRAGRARLGVGGRAGSDPGVPRPSPSVPAALGRMTQQPKQRQRQEEAAGGRRGEKGRGGTNRLGGRVVGGKDWGEGGAGVGGRAPPHPTSLTSSRPGGRQASGGLSAAGAGGQSDRP